MLEHGYTSAKFSFARLKGVDQWHFAELQNACQKTGLHIFLANIEKTDMDGVNEDGYTTAITTIATKTMIVMISTALKI